MQRLCAIVLLLVVVMQGRAPAADAALREQALEGLNRATKFFREEVARNGGYQYKYSVDLKRSFGEIRRGFETAVTVQPPGTPAVGMVFLDAYEVTEDRVHLDAALQAAACLLKGQLRSGGWGYGVEFDPKLRRTHAYRVEPASANQKNMTVLDDNTTQFALQFLMRLDKTLDFKEKRIHEAVEYALKSLLRAQYPNGAWPQRYESFVDPRKYPVKKASFVDKWSRTYPGRNYKAHYTFNDNAIADVIKTLFKATEIYGDQRFRKAALKAGDFILLALLPEPQPAWAQQYDLDMHPTWARRFEPPAISGRESQDILLALLDLYRRSGDPKYLEPIAPAVAYFRRSRLSDGRIARFYEMKTNKPLYFTKEYELTYSDADMPTHYSFKTGDRLDGIEEEYTRLRAAESSKAGVAPPPRSPEAIEALARAALEELDDKGRWLNQGTVMRDTPEPTGQIIQSGTFVRYATGLCDYLRVAGK